ncbi:hypothetical protein [Bacteroides sp.]|uniref:hypothetical protein n=1 Tax=Bacteroides sp. TaxID=29523 RepID=UPI00260A50E9|nr:hypothetical protein [Bacteroides sp.]
MKTTISPHTETRNRSDDNNNMMRIQRTTPEKKNHPHFLTDRDLILPAIFVFVCGALVMAIIAIIFLATSSTLKLY